MRTCRYCGARIDRGAKETPAKFAKRNYCDQKCRGAGTALGGLSASDLAVYMQSADGKAFIAECRRPRFRRAA